MRRAVTRLAACLALAAVSLAGCGDKAPGIARRDASELVGLLKVAREQADNPEQCAPLLATIRQIDAKVRSLPSKVDKDVRDTLENGVRNLAASAEQQCAQTQTVPTTPTTPTVPETTPTTPTETTPTETTPPETTPPETTPPETTPPETTPPATTPNTGGQGPGNGKKHKTAKGEK